MKLPPRPRLRPRLKFEQLEDRITPTSSTVTTLLDVVNPNDGVISLREAIAAAEADGAADTIDFAPALAKGTISLSQFDTGLDNGEVGPSAFNITTAITILGSGQVIQRDSQASNFRLFFVSSAGGLTLDNLELRSGFARGGNGFSGGGGAAGLGGAIFNQGTLTVRNSLLDGNTAQGGNGSTVNFQFGAGGGGGLGQSASNASGGGPNGGSGGNGGFGGGGSGNSEGLAGNGGFGGGGGSATFNTVGGLGGFGGGDGGSDAGFLSRGLGANPANGANGGAGAGMGGAIFNLFGTTNVINSTITGNRTIGGTDGGGSPRGRGLGGGVFNLNGTLKVVNSTFDANRADFGGSIYNFSQDATDGIPSQQAAVATLANSIFEDSTNPDLLGADSLPAASGDEVHNAFLVKGNVTSGSFLATIDASAPNITNNGGFVNENGDLNSSGLIVGTGSVVTALADNGGLTRTMALVSRSAAVDVGSNAKATDPVTSAALTTDQRGPGFPRIGLVRVDLGAFEIPSPIVSLIGIDDTADENTPNDTLSFKLTRTGDLSQPLAVSTNIVFNGLSVADFSGFVATGGTFAQAGSIFTFSANSDTITVISTPVNDIQAEAAESYTVSIPSQPGIVLGTSTTDTGTITQNDFVVTVTDDTGEGSLRQAILNAEALPGADVVTFIPSLVGATINLTTFTNLAAGIEAVPQPAGPSAFAITTPVTIQGTGQVITRNVESSNFRFFFVNAAGNLTLENLELQGGIARGGNGVDGGGGAAGLGGAIFNQGTLTIRNSTLDGNQAIGGNGGAGASGRGGTGMGGAIYNSHGTVNVVNSTITSNFARRGMPGGVDAPQGAEYGGGLSNFDGTVNVTNSTFKANGADVGGSIYNLADFAPQIATTTLVNSIFVDSISSRDEVRNEQGQFGRPPANRFDPPIAVAIVIASAPNITNGGGFVNLAGTTMDASGVITATRPVVSSALGDNGGLTRTLALTADSEALNVGDNTKAKDPATSAALATDQRGGTFPRIADGTVDLGAFEAPATSPPTPPPPPPAGKPGTIVFVSPTFVVVQNGQAGQPNPADPFPLFDGENRVAVGDVNHDGIPDFIFSAGDGGGPHIRVISGKDGSVLHNFFAYDSSFRGGAFVASGDLNGDGFADIVTGAGERGGPHVRAFSGKDGTIIADFFAYDPNFRGGVTVAVGDVNGDGVHDIITGPGPGGGSQIEVIDGTKLGLKNPITAQILPAAVYASFFAFDPSFIGGVFVGAGNLDGDKFADIVAGPLTRGSPRAVVFTGKALQQANSIFTSDPGLRTGLRFTLADTNGDGIDELIVVAGPGGGPQEVVINPLTGEVIQSVFFSDPASRSGFGVG